MRTALHAPQPRGDLESIVRRAEASVPLPLSARRGSVRVCSSLGLAACLVVPYLGVAPADVVIATLVALAVMLRAWALAHLLRGGVRAVDPAPPVLPTITVLLPLCDEASVVEALVAAVVGLDYPTDLVEVLVLIEAGDHRTASALEQHAPPAWKILSLPPGQPRTKPRACNAGLALARGDVVVVFDGEDRPEPDQALKAVAALAADPRLAVVQARLGCDHARPGAPLLARFWALEYAVLFGAIQPVLARAGLPFLFGGTSNWCRASALRAVGGWDAHNVTEDADVAVRLARAGWSASIIDSTTWEEAPVHVGQWLRQRSRWLKGFAVTTAVHSSRPFRCGAELGPVATLAIVAQLPATLVSAAAHPLGLWLIVRGSGSVPATLLACAGYGIAVALCLAVARRENTAWWVAALMPAYWLLQTVALVGACVDLVRSPARWHKTAHGLVERPLPNRGPSQPAPRQTDAGDETAHPPAAANAPAEPDTARLT